MNKVVQNTGFLKTLLPFITLMIASCGSRTDEEVQKDIQQTLQKKSGSNTSYSNTRATVDDGVAQLTGECEGENCVDSAALWVKEVDGVKKIENKIKQTQTGTDFTLRTSVQGVISKYQGVQADVAAGVIVLRGTIQRAQLQPLMNELSALQPKKIDNQLAIQ